MVESQFLYSIEVNSIVYLIKSNKVKPAINPRCHLAGAIYKHDLDMF